MNDITVLALLVSKAKASAFTMEYISQFEASDIDSDDVDLRFEVDGVETGTNVSIVDECGQAAQMIRTLVEALEAEQPHHNGMMQLSNELVMAKQRIAELESRTVTVKLPDLPILGSSAEWYQGFAAGASGMRKDCATALRAAGIQVIEGEA
ncbi:hypothetical protein I4W53_11600 [Kluyvera sichuanensis]